MAVLQPNYRGSLSFGADFGEALLGQVDANPNPNRNPNPIPNPNPNLGQVGALDVDQP